MDHIARTPNACVIIDFKVIQIFIFHVSLLGHVTPDVDLISIYHSGVSKETQISERERPTPIQTPI